MAAITFEDYFIEEAKYSRNKHFNPDTTEINLGTEFSAKINASNKEALVALNVVVGSLEDDNQPFFIEASIKGIFTFEDDEAQGISFDSYLKNNSVAILYPYIRSLVSDLTSRSNQFPAFYLPVINIAMYLEKDGRIEFNKN
ncbi:hypothetical protein HB897_06985 [Listeria seeligeri]|uniref:Preprotein translocase subunit SecB n=1 Tax=Listeria seeligeri TaxID=1640 RepID=A0A7X0X1Q5_LISSE|nr:protein-export chaperone SecB [Listeria seeligeri]ECR3484335.1 hypothetical protein [Listeria innocua]EED2043114.1 hypothetical protein [Listeria innocua]MBC1485970.1 hypothetical protein [Listeria seeligeri]